ncbi:cellulose-binding protein [Streptomyces sp. NPDC014733]|uniref:cellulose-binding protein n=1 Tax=Streptomyces sp. NPDC014733 TaxID=3364885 RepID=UPI0036FD75DF
MSASVSPHGFVTVRGRGYRPDDVDRRVAGLTVDRDSCWERVAQLTETAEELAAELAELRAYVATMPPQTYESLGEQARLILTTAESEAARLRADAERAAEELRDATVAYACDTGEAADEVAHARRKDAEERGQRTVDAARADAAARVKAAQKDAAQWREEAAEALQEMRRRTAELLAGAEQQQADAWEECGREIAAREAETARLIVELEERGREIVAQAERHRAETEEAARHRQEDAEARAAELLAQAGVEVERIERATARILREHQEERDELRSHMTHVRNSLAALTGKDPGDLAGASVAASGDAGPGDGPAAPGAAGAPDAAPAAPAGPTTGPAAGELRTPVNPDDEDTIETELPRTT